MCNIAGYAGNQQAAPLLLDMLRRQEAYDGGLSAGVITIHEGKLYHRKVVGDVDTLVRKTDALELPGTIGIAHVRPGFVPGAGPMQPFLSGHDTMALAVNGTHKLPETSKVVEQSAEFLVRNGYEFRHQWENPERKTPRHPINGNCIHSSEVRAHLVDYSIKNGAHPTKALAEVGNQLYDDVISVLLHQDFPDEIFVSRTTRPMEAVVNDGECYIATTRFGLPEGLESKSFSLPLSHSCIITRDGVRVTSERVDHGPVSEMTPFAYTEGYKRVEALLREKPVYFDELEFALDELRDLLWPGNQTLVQHARLVYELLWQFETEGRLKRELRMQEITVGPRPRWYFWLED